MDNKQPRGIEELKRARNISTQEDKNKEQFGYVYVDSYLDNSDKLEDWGKGNLFDNFYSVIEGEGSLKKYIENILQKKRSQAIGIEFGGLGINLFKGFSPGFFK